MENAYKKVLPSFFNEKKSTGLVSDGAGDFLNTEELGKYLPAARNLFQQTKGSQSELGQNEALFLRTPSANEIRTERDKNFLLRENEQPPLCKINSAHQTLGTSPDMKITDATSEKVVSQMPQKNVLFEACMTSQPLNASLRDKWTIGTYYFLQ
jgi:hypothetical protein